MAGRGRESTLPAWLIASQSKTGQAPAGHGIPIPMGGAPFNPALANNPTSHGMAGRGMPPNVVPSAPNAPPFHVNPNAVAPSASATWTEHIAPNGKKYYHNRSTGVSSWTMPEEMKASLSPATSLPLPPVAAKLGDIEEAKKNAPVIGNVSVSVKEIETPEPKKEGKEYNTREEKIEGFKQLLLETKIETDWNWEMAVRVLVSDQRYELLKTGEKKQLFNEHIVYLKNKEKEEKKEKERRAREDFKVLLASKPAIVPGFPYRKALLLFGYDPRYQAIPSEREKEEVYADYLADMEKREKEAQRLQKIEARKQFKQMLEDNYQISVRTTWRKAQELLQSDPRFINVKDPMDRLLAFEDHIRELEKQEETDRAKSIEELRKTERLNREAFRGFIKKLVDAGQMDITTRWRGFVSIAKNAPEFMNMIGQAGTTPKEIFFDSLFELEDVYDEQKKTLKALVKDAPFELKPDTTEEDLTKFFKKYERTHSFPDANIQEYIRELLEKAKSKKRKQEKKFFKLLKKKSVSSATVYSEIREKLSTHSGFKDIAAEEERIKLFNDYITELNETKDGSDSSESDGNSSDEENGDKKKDDRDRKSGHSKKNHRSRKSRSPEREDRNRDKQSKRSESPKERKFTEKADDEHKSKKRRSSP